MDIIDIEFQPGGLGLVFDDGTSATANYRVIAGVLYFEGLTKTQRLLLEAFNQRIAGSVRNNDPRFGGGGGIGLDNIAEDTSPQLGGDLDTNSFRIADQVGAPVARGFAAVDLQLQRFNVDDVAGGWGSFIAGGSWNKVDVVAWGGNVHGKQNRVSGKYGQAEGSNVISSGEGATAEGYATTASGRAAFAGGDNTDATGDHSHSEGHETVAVGIASHAEAWMSATAGDYSYAGGHFSMAIGYASVAGGSSSEAALYGQVAHAAGMVSEQGDAQRTETIGRVTTSDQAFNEVYLDGVGASEKYVISLDKFYAITITVVAHRDSSSEGAVLRRMATIENTLGTVTLHFEDTIGTDFNPGNDYSIQLSADDGVGEKHLLVEVKHNDGVGAKTVRWVIRLEAVEVNSPILLSPSLSPSISASISTSPSISGSPSPSFPSSSPSISLSPSFPSSSPSVSISPSLSMSMSPTP